MVYEFFRQAYRVNILIMNRLHLTLSIIFSLVFSCLVQAQISLDCNDNADQLVNYLVDGVDFENATVSGFDCSTGYFEGTDLNISLTSGIAMATGGLTGGSNSVIPDETSFVELSSGAGVDQEVKGDRFTTEKKYLGKKAEQINNNIKKRVQNLWKQRLGK